MTVYTPCRDCASEGFRLTDGLCDGCLEHARRGPKCVTGDASWLHQRWCDWRAWRRARKALR